MKTLLSTVESALSDFLDLPSQTFLLGLSGGLDSMVLLSLLSELSQAYPHHHFSAAYINHGLNADAQSWATHCAKSCEKMGIPFTSLNVSLPAKSVAGMEADAREARYEALLGCLPDKGCLLLAQHQDDQAETFLLQLKRGAGPKGLAGMPLVRETERGINICRPLLTATREDLYQFAIAKGLKWVEDPSNQDSSIERNFLRNDVLPVIKSRWPEFSATVSRSAQLCGEQQSLLDEVVGEKLRSVLTEPDQLPLDAFLELDPRWQRQLLRQWVFNVTGLLPPQSLLRELNNVIHAREDANPEVKLDIWSVRRFRNVLYLMAQPHGRPAKTSQYTLNEQVSIELEDGFKLVFKAENDAFSQLQLPSKVEHPSLEVRYGEYAEKFRPSYSEFSKPLKQWFKAWEMPPWEREKVAKVYVEAELSAIVIEGRLIVNGRAEGDFLIGVSVEAPAG